MHKKKKHFLQKNNHFQRCGNSNIDSEYTRKTSKLLNRNNFNYKTLKFIFKPINKHDYSTYIQIHQNTPIIIRKLPMQTTESKNFQRNHFIRKNLHIQTNL